LGRTDEEEREEGDALRFPDALQIKIDMSEKDPDERNAFPRIFLPKAGRWSVSVQAEREIPEPTQEPLRRSHWTLGWPTFATTSSGFRIHPDAETFLVMKRAPLGAEETLPGIP
jgi:hypothetical protein